MHSLDVFHGGIEEFDYLVKLDDDSYVDMDALLEVLNASPRLSHYRGLFFTGKPYRDPSHKNYVSPKCLPLPVLPPFAYGGGFVLSWDLVDYVVNNHRVLEKGLIRDKDGDRCCDLDDLQVGLWMFALGVELVHEDRFNGLLNCHRDTIILYDVPEWLMLEVHEGVKKGGVCNDAIHEYLLGSSKPEHVASLKVGGGRRAVTRKCCCP
ncbi:hypothetical protein TrLO_g6347 [Triparma laevis f. longispina]|uniref:Hexosyltransferase n=1 Tax=Triparma laevis f. longispina TaxID=1714387 RepID=A0A9W7CF33_9STRA|nr:hypothetical protein TrLO_g6347 [Triparma laevis f. longispina]